MNKNILKTTTILTSLVFLTFASLSYASVSKSPKSLESLASGLRINSGADSSIVLKNDSINNEKPSDSSIVLINDSINNEKPSDGNTTAAPASITPSGGPKWVH
jgi:hypothetical protein